MKLETSGALKLVLIALTVGALGCTSRTDYIIPVNFEKYEKEFMPTMKGLTQEDIDEIFARQLVEIEQNTIGKELPNIMVEDMNGHEVDLGSIINGLTLTCLSSAHCGWGMEALSNDVPKALKQTNSKGLEIEAICLFIKEEQDIENMEVFNSKLNELKSIYHDIYIVSSSESKRMNVIADPTIMLIDNDKTVVDIYMGDTRQEALSEYLLKKLHTTTAM